MEIVAGHTTSKGGSAKSIARIRSIPLTILLCAIVVVGFVLMALLADQIAPYDPLKQSLRYRLQPPYWLSDGIEEGQPLYFFGSDQLGRDVLSRIVHGSRISLMVAFSAVTFGGVVGSLLGLLAGYFGKAFDEITMTVADIQLSFPFILLAIAVIAVLGPSLANLIILIGISGWVTYARIARAEVLGVKEKEYIEAIRCLGGGSRRIMFRHVLPNILSPLIVVGTLDLARTIILESTLSFLGLGIQPPTPSWGGMLGEGRGYLDSAWWIATFPGLFLMAVTLSVSRIGDWVRDVKDPTMKGA